MPKYLLSAPERDLRHPCGIALHLLGTADRVVARSPRSGHLPEWPRDEAPTEVGANVSRRPGQGGPTT